MSKNQAFEHKSDLLKTHVWIIDNSTEKSAYGTFVVGTYGGEPPYAAEAHSIDAEGLTKIRDYITNMLERANS